MLDEIGVPNLEKREMFRGVFDGRYKLLRYFGMGNYNLPASVKQLLAENDVALYDLQSDPEEIGTDWGEEYVYTLGLQAYMPFGPSRCAT